MIDTAPRMLAAIQKQVTDAGYHVIRLRNMLPPVAGALCFTVAEDPDPETVTRVVELVRELQGLSVA